MKIVLALIVSFTFLTYANTVYPVLGHPQKPLSSAAHSESGGVEDERGIVALDQTLREITNPFTVLSVSARPGDEDDGTLAYVRKKLGARVVMLFATRGESEDSWPDTEDLNLGTIHTNEAVEAARLVGADVFFLNLRDIGYSKSPDEALSAWGHDEALRRMVRAIRSLRPDVIITNHDSKSGEGVERAVARLALEAFSAAASAEPPPEAGSESWRTRRFFQRASDKSPDAKVDLTEFDRVRGKTYAQIGLAAHHRFISRRAHLDQLTPDRELSYYKRIASSSDEGPKPDTGLIPGLLDGLTIPENVSQSILQPRVGGVGLLDSIATGERLVDALVERLIEKRAEGTAETLHTRYGPDFVRVYRFREALERAIVLALGLSLEVSPSDRLAVPGQMISAKFVFRNGGIRVLPVQLSTPERLSATDQNLTYKDSDVFGVGPGGALTREIEYEIPKDSALTVPRKSHLYDEEYFPIASSLPGTQPAESFGGRLIVFAEVALGQVNVRLAALARFDVTSPVEISTIPFALVQDWAKQKEISFPVRLRNRTPSKLSGALWVVPLALADDEYDPVHISFVREDEEVTIQLKLRLPILKPPLAPDVLLEFRREKPASADPLGSAKIVVKAAEFEVADGLKVGYVKSLNNWISFALTELGVEHSELRIAEITVTEHGNANTTAQSRLGCGDLARFDTIIIDSAAYYAHPELMSHNRCLLRYVRQGGNLVVLDQVPDDWNLLLSNTAITPYTIRLSKDRIVYEAASVKILDPDNPLMSKPNKMSSKDFDGWVLERALNIPREWSKEFVPLLESADPGEEPNRGGLLVARYGEGTYIYTSCQWRLQLLAGNAGSFRMLANLVSLAKLNKAPTKPQ
ncbi:MAG TPA: PIG-L family deacetylase [Blastocatellia bacterium]|nr:PIG-L family deacetylase [Blastocatellia bacterium]